MGTKAGALPTPNPIRPCVRIRIRTAVEPHPPQYSRFPPGTGQATEIRPILKQPGSSRRGIEFSYFCFLLFFLL